MVRPIEEQTQAPGQDSNAQDGENPPVAAKLVVDYMRRLIESGRFKAGDKLPPERELAQLIGVSRATVRAGLQSLATVGVVDSRRGAGTFVAEGPPLLDVNPLSLFSALHGIPRAELFEARRVIEIDLAGLAAERAHGDELALISEEVMEMFASIDDVHRFLVHDIRFHRAVATAARNPLLAAIMEMVADLFYDQRKKTVDRWRDAPEAAEQHRRIYQAIRAGDVERARKEMDTHLQWAQEAQEIEVKATHDRDEGEK
ncbi:MAG: FadR family transcriptional regulator [Acidobacteriota bacterium]|nr:FadR family transcriptional regulator [Acidobacteriota bacterium]